MRVAVTGAAGFIGSHVLARLAVDHEVVAIVRRHVELPGEVAVHDLTAGASLPQVDAVVHAAAAVASAGVQRFARDNVAATAAVADWLVEIGAQRVVYLSSISVHGRVSTAVLDERTPIVDPGVYGLSKLLGEHLIAACDIPGVAIRLPGVAGPGATPGTWLGRVAEDALAGRPIRITNPDHPFTVATTIEAVADLVAAAIERPMAAFEAFPVGAEASMSVIEAVEFIRHRLGSRSPIGVERDGQPPYSVSSDRAKLLGYRPPALPEVLQHVISAATPPAPDQ